MEKRNDLEYANSQPNEEQIEHIEYVENGISNCCGALVELHSERCSECKEYCDTEKK